MTNEELAAAVKAGREDLITELWEQCENYIRLQASRWERAWKGKRHDFDFDDFFQAGYFALLKAVDKWDPERGKCFIGFLDLCLKTVFAEVAGCRTKAQKKDIMYTSERLESPVPGKRSDGKERTLAETIGGYCEGLEAIEEKDYQECIVKAVREAVARLPENCRKAVEGHFLEGLKYTVIAEELGVTMQRAQQLGQSGLRKMRENPSNSDLKKLYFGERNLYRGTGYTSWRDTGMSAPEREAMRLESLLNSVQQ